MGYNVPTVSFFVDVLLKAEMRKTQCNDVLKELTILIVECFKGKIYRSSVPKNNSYKKQKTKETDDTNVITNISNCRKYEQLS